MRRRIRWGRRSIDRPSPATRPRLIGDRLATAPAFPTFPTSCGGGHDEYAGRHEASQRGANSKNRLSTLAYPRSARCLCLSRPEWRLSQAGRGRDHEGSRRRRRVADVLLFRPGACPHCCSARLEGFALELSPTAVVRHSLTLWRGSPQPAATLASLKGSTALSRCWKRGGYCGGVHHENHHRTDVLH